MTERPALLYYALRPVYAPKPGDPPQLATAAIVECLATGKQLAGMGGGGLALSPEVVDQLDWQRNNGARVIMNQSDWDMALNTLAAISILLGSAVTEAPGEDVVTLPSGALLTGEGATTLIKALKGVKNLADAALETINGE